MTGIALVALPVSALVILAALRSPLARRLVASPRGDRWHEQVTPSIGGFGIFAGILAGVGVAGAAGVVDVDGALLGILAGCTILFVAGLADDLHSLSPVVKLGAQVAAAAVVIVTGTRVEIVSNPVLATAIAVLWLVGMTNAFNLLDNMDGLAATLAAIACAFFAIDALTHDRNAVVATFSFAVAAACVGFLPFNLRLHKPAAVFMGDSGSQVIGFALASLSLVASWKLAGTTVATLLLPILVLAVPILDTALVVIVRLLEGRPIYQGGRDHTSHRLVYYGLSEKRAVAMLALISAGLGATSLGYTVLPDTRLTAIGVLLTFVLLVQFGSFLAQVERGPVASPPDGSLLARTLLVHRRRLVEVLVDAALFTAAFLGAYLFRIHDSGTPWNSYVFNVSLPVIMAARYLAFIVFGLYRSVWRFAGARDALAIVSAVLISEAVAVGFLAATQDWKQFPRAVFVLDALFCIILVGASRFAERGLFRTLLVLRGRSERHRALVVGAGRAGRSLLRELNETAGEQVVGFVDDDPRLWGRRLQGVRVLGGADEIDRVLAQTHPDAVLVTIPNAPRDRLDPIVSACARAGIDCRFVRRELDLAPGAVLWPRRRVTVATAEPRAAETTARARTGVDRLLAALPLTLVFLTAVTIYAYQAWAHHTPWLFSDEIEYTDLSRAIAATGHPALRGEPHGFETLYAYLIAPVWWLHSTSAAYALAKYIGVVVMSASLFPAYFLARMLVRPPAALAAAALTAAAPALGYSSFLIIEPLAYTWSALTCFLVVKALATRGRWWIGTAVVSLLVAPSIRDELKVLIPAALAACAWMLWTSARAERMRTRWTWLHWVGLALLLPVIAYGLSETAGAYSGYWHVAVHELGDRVVRYGNWATGALVIGLGVLPVVVALTVLARPRDEERTPAFRAFVGLFGASIALFWIYTALKAAYLSTVFATRVEERNMIYLIPLVAVAFAVFLDRPRVRLWALAASGAIVGYLLYTTPYQLSIRPYSDAPGLSVLGWANRQYRWADPDVQKALLGALAFSLLFGVAVAFGGRRFRAAMAPVLAAVAIGVLAWNLTGEISFANASNGQSRMFVKYLPHPLDWVDRATGRQPTAYIGEAMSEGNGTWSLEFWNRSIVRIGSLDNTAPGPGAVLKPVPYAGDGRVINDPKTPFVLAGKGVDPQGTLVARRGDLRLYRIHGPLRLRSYVTGVYPDGWTGKEATYSRFATGPRRPGTLTIIASREGWKGNSLAGVVSIAIGTLRPASLATIHNPCEGGHCVDTAPTIERQLAFRQVTVGSGELKRLRVRVTPPFQVELAVYPTFAPADFGAYDKRQLGVQTQFGFAPGR